MKKIYKNDVKVLINNAGESSFKLPTEYTKEDIEKCFKGLQGMIITSTQVLKAKEEKDVKLYLSCFIWLIEEQRKVTKKS